MHAINFTGLTRFFAEIEPESTRSHSPSHIHGGDDHSHFHGHGGGHTHSHDSSDHGINEGDMDKVRSTLKQLVRDWSEEVSDAPLLNPGRIQIPRRVKGNARRATPP